MFCVCEILLKLKLQCFTPTVDLELDNTVNGESLFLTSTDSGLSLLFKPVWELVSHLVESQHF